MGCVTTADYLFPDEHPVRRSGGQCSLPDPDALRGRCEYLATYVYRRQVDGRRRVTACCPAHYRELVAQHGPEVRS